MIIISRKRCFKKAVQEDLNPRLIYYFMLLFVQAVILSRTKKVIVTITSGFGDNGAAFNSILTWRRHIDWLTWWKNHLRREIKNNTMNTTLFTYPSFLLEIHTQPNQRKDKIKVFKRLLQWTWPWRLRKKHLLRQSVCLLRVSLLTDRHVNSRHFLRESLERRLQFDLQFIPIPISLLFFLLSRSLKFESRFLSKCTVNIPSCDIYRREIRLHDS